MTHVGQRIGKEFYVYDQIFMEVGSIPEMCQMFYDRWGTYKNQIWIYGDATGQNRNAQTGNTDYALVSNALRSYGISHRLKVPDRNPPVIDRLNAMNRALLDEEGEICLHIDPKCVELSADLEQVLMDPGGGVKKSKNPSDPYYYRTHASDGVGYWIVYEAPVKLQSRGPRIAHGLRDISYKFY